MFLDGLAAGTAAPAGGSAAALAVALAAALCAKTARLSARQLTADRAEQLTSAAERIRTTAASLIDADALAYRGVIEATRRRAGAAQLADALSRAADVPMQVVELAAEVAELAADLAATGNPALRGDAITAVLLAESGARAAATLVTINLTATPTDARHARAAKLLTGIAQSARGLTPNHAS